VKTTPQTHVMRTHHVLTTQGLLSVMNVTRDTLEMVLLSVQPVHPTLLTERAEMFLIVRVTVDFMVMDLFVRPVQRMLMILLLAMKMIALAMWDTLVMVLIVLPALRTRMTIRHQT
jgi:hypothetical protein